MRRMHWWGVAAGVGLLVAGGAAAPEAFASTPHHGAPAPAKRVVVKSDGHRGHDDDYNRHHPRCPYPPHGKPDNTISGPGRAGRAVVITGAMKINGCGYEGHAAALYKLVKGKRHELDQWAQVATATTGKDGGMSFTVAGGTGKYRIMTAGGDGLCESWSDTLDVEYHGFRR